MVTQQLLKKRQSGFTLIEILVVLVITGILLQGLSQLTGGYLRAWMRSATSLEDQSSAFNATTRMAEEINGLLALYQIGTNDEPIGIFSGTQNTMVMVRPSVGFVTTRNLDRVSYSIESGPTGVAIIRRSTRMAVSDPFSTVTNETRSVLAEIAGNVTFEYSSDGAEYSASWNSSAAGPKTVRINFTLERFGDMVFSKIAYPFVNAPVRCLVPEDINFCNQFLAGNP